MDVSSTHHSEPRKKLLRYTYLYNYAEEVRESWTEGGRVGEMDGRTDGGREGNVLLSSIATFCDYVFSCC